jgi:hypothetical protein
MATREEQVQYVLGRMTNIIVNTINTKPKGISFDFLAFYFQASEAEIHKAVFSLGCAVDENTHGYVVMTVPTYSPSEATKRFIEGKEL